ncbi:MAG: hypothetical protein K8I29_19310 [Alphaproteobacteria bacterium]|uniref:Uncharacterized protein n=1 Tax=Candidatus Nitrobium versatile TaxID=2884831 RepID=A0A953SH26_9BACT|nr:hypothetical protein [Candidatus Nitrobium versatile]
MSDIRGFVHTHLLAAVLLSATLAAVLARSGRVDATFFTKSGIVSQIVAQANMIRQKVVACSTLYPSGNNGTGNHISYPGGNDVAVSTLTCPGSGQNLWTGVDGQTLPKAPNGFSDWKYINDTTSVRIYLRATSLPASQSAMQKAFGYFNQTLPEASLLGNDFVLTISL